MRQFVNSEQYLIYDIEGIGKISYKMEPKPGEGIRSMKTSNAFRVLNFELYTAPNKMVMGFGIVAILGCAGYIAYMRKKYEGMGYYPAVDSEGNEKYIKKKSKWDD